MYLYWKEFRRAHFIYVPNSVSWHIYRGWDEYGYSRLVLSIGSEEHILDDGEIWRSNTLHSVSMPLANITPLLLQASQTAYP